MVQIEFRNVKKKFSIKWPALEDVSFKIEKGDFVFLVGPTGSGKTTVLRHIYMEIFPDEGDVLWEGKSTKKLRKSEILEIRRKMGIVFQDLKLIPSRSVFENVAFVLRLAGEGELTKKVYAVLKAVGIIHKSQVPAKDLSRGELQRLAVARALARHPEILLADEPFGNINKEDAEEILKLLVDFNNSGSTVIIATHNTDLVNLVARKKIIKLSEGRVVNEY